LSKEKELESSSFKAWQGRKVIDYLSAIMQHILSNNDQTRLRAWQSMVLKYLQVMRFAFQRQGRKVIDNFSAIMQHILSNNDQTRLRAWHLQVMRFAFRHEDFNEVDLEEFQDLIDEWFYLG
jgi:hypothetical protein